MYKKNTIVTAFFPINREEWKGFERSNNKYIEYFKFWARMHNDMVIYTNSFFSSEIKRIRDEYGRYNTKIVEIDDINLIDKELYNSIINVSKNNKSVDFRIYPEFPESWNADYNYTVCLKAWFVQDAVTRFNIDGIASWIDFGFNHGGEVYIDSKDFDFEWNFDFDDKINIFLKHEMDDKPIFEICRKMDTYVQGSIMIAPTSMWGKFWNETRNKMMCLNEIGLMDDDQTITLMVYRAHPSWFSTHLLERWHTMLIYFSNQKFKINIQDAFNLNGIKKLKSSVRYRMVIGKYQKKWKKIMIREEVKG